MKDLDKTINKYKTMLKNHEHNSIVGILFEVRDLLKVMANGSADKSEVGTAVESAFEKGKPEFEKLLAEIKTSFGDQDGFVLLSHPCESGEYSLMFADDKYNTDKIEKPLSGWWLSMADAQSHKKDGLSLVVCKVPLDKISAIHDPVMIKDTVSEMVLNGQKKGMMSLSVEPGSYTVKEKYTGDW